MRKFEEGMHSCGQNTLNARQAAATETGLTLNTINVRLTCQHWDDVYMQSLKLSLVVLYAICSIVSMI